MIEIINKLFPKQPPEKESGNKEYKRILKLNIKKKKYKEFIENRGSQMLYRLIEGKGKATYILGLEDNGQVYGISINELWKTIILLHKISNNINANIKAIRIYLGGKGYVVTARITLPHKILQDKIKYII